MSKEITKRVINNSFTPRKNVFGSKNCDVFVKKAKHIQFPIFLIDLLTSKELTDTQFKACFLLWSHCYIKNQVDFTLSTSELTEVMLCGRDLAMTTIKRLEGLNILDSGRSSFNEQKKYRWNVELWASHKPVVDNIDRGSRLYRPWQSIKSTVAVDNIDYVYIQEYLLQYLSIISLRIVSDQLQRNVDKSDTDNEGKLKVSLSATISIEERLAFWQKAIIENVPSDRRYLALWFFNDTSFDFASIEYPEKLLGKIFSDDEYLHKVHSDQNYIFENQKEFFDLYKKHLVEELPLEKMGGVQ